MSSPNMRAEGVDYLEKGYREEMKLKQVTLGTFTCKYINASAT